MYRLSIFCLACVLAMVSAIERTNVIKLRKMIKISTLTPMQLYYQNMGHLIYNFYGDATPPKRHLNSFHNLQYAGMIKIGDPPQKLTVYFDIGSADVMVLSRNYCRFPSNIAHWFCWIHNTYNDKKSKSAKSVTESPTSFDLDYYSEAQFKGHLVSDDIKISDGLIVKEAVIGVTESWRKGFFFGRVDGIVGLGFKGTSKFSKQNYISNNNENELSTVLGHTTFTEHLKSNDIQRIGLHLYKDTRGYNVGYLIFGAVTKSKRHKGDIVWFKQPEGTSYWQVTSPSIQVISMHTGEFSTLPNVQKYPVYLDPGTSFIAGPSDLIDPINLTITSYVKAIQRTKKQGTIEFDCLYREQFPILALVLTNPADSKDVGFILEPKDYILQLQGKRVCTTGFTSIPDLKVMILGDQFFHKYYTLFDIDSLQVGFAESVPPHLINEYEHADELVE